jgi:hypothetical protein
MCAAPSEAPSTSVILSGTESLLTLGRREVDSNLQYRAVNGKVWPERKRFQPVTVENAEP